MVSDELAKASFVRRRGRGRSVSVTCATCGYTQYDIRPSSQRGSGDRVTCACCGAEGDVRDVSRCSA